VKNSLDLTSLSVAWFEFGDLTPIGFPRIPNSAVMNKGDAIGNSGFTTWTSNSVYPEAEGFPDRGTYDIVGKNAKGADFKFVGPPTKTAPICFANGK
jgi:hypothetical protein